MQEPVRLDIQERVQRLLNLPRIRIRNTLLSGSGLGVSSFVSHVGYATLSRAVPRTDTNRTKC
jgi:hypothetical protein